MDLKQFFDYWNLEEHPFQAEEARNDSVYKSRLLEAITHPDFSKIYGDPANPSSTIVFGEKGAGKTAMRLLIQQKLDDFNASRESGRVWLVCYDDLNPVLDRLSRHAKTDDAEKALATVRLSDHQDAVLSIAVTELIDSVLASNDKAQVKKRTKALRKMSRQKRIDLATLALLYDQPKHGRAPERWEHLLQILRVGASWSRGPHAFLTVLLGVLGLAGIGVWKFMENPAWWWYAAAILGTAGFGLLGYWWLIRAWKNRKRERQIEKELQVISREPGCFHRQLWDLSSDDLASQPLPAKGDQDSRYDLTGRLLGVLGEMGYSGMIVLVDRVDEPVLVNGDAKRIKKAIWPMLNNKFLQQERIGVKMLLPIETSQMLLAEDSEFRRQARLDKQNVVNPLKWTGPTLYDLCSWRFKNCQKGDISTAQPLSAIFEDEVDSEDLIDALDQMHQPRDAFKFLYAVILEHCRNTSTESRFYRISKSTLELVRREQSQRVLDLYRGMTSA